MAAEVARWREEIEALEVNLLLNESYDERDAYILLYPYLPFSCRGNPWGGRAGRLAREGGSAHDESRSGQHLAELLVRMYTGWAESKGFTVNVIEQVRGKWYGVRRAMLQVRGSYAYGYARTQRGVHQLMKRSPDTPREELARGLALVTVMPDIEERSEMPIRLEEVRVDLFRAPRYACFDSYPKLAVRLTHIPTNVVVTYEANKGSEARCFDAALHLLRVRLLGRLLQQQANMTKEDQGGSGRIREDQEKPICTYMLSPSGLVTDHRTGEQSEEVDAVLDGGIERFMAAYLRHDAPSRGAS